MGFPFVPSLSSHSYHKNLGTPSFAFLITTDMGLSVPTKTSPPTGWISGFGNSTALIFDTLILGKLIVCPLQVTFPSMIYVNTLVELVSTLTSFVVAPSITVRLAPIPRVHSYTAVSSVFLTAALNVNLSYWVSCGITHALSFSLYVT